MWAPQLRNERGMALAIALFALVIIGSLVAGTLFSGRLEQQSGSNTLYGSQAAEAADAGVSDVIGTTTAPTLLALPVGGAAANLGNISLGGRVDATREISRLTSSVFLVRSTGTRRNAAGGPLAAHVTHHARATAKCAAAAEHRRAGVLVRPGGHPHDAPAVLVGLPVRQGQQTRDVVRLQHLDRRLLAVEVEADVDEHDDTRVLGARVDDETGLEHPERHRDVRPHRRTRWL